MSRVEVVLPFFGFFKVHMRCTKPRPRPPGARVGGVSAERARVKKWVGSPGATTRLWGPATRLGSVSCLLTVTPLEGDGRLCRREPCRTPPVSVVSIGRRVQLPPPVFSSRLRLAAPQPPPPPSTVCQSDAGASGGLQVAHIQGPT